MSEDRRKNLRTQGKYSDGKVQKSRDKKQKSSLGSKDSPETRLPKKNSDNNGGVNNSLAGESESPFIYKEHSDYTFHQLEEAVKPEEIKGQEDFILNKSDNGESRILYEPQFLDSDEGDNYFNILCDTVQFDSRNIVIRGVEYPQPRLVAWFGPFSYSYSGVTLEAAEMPDVVLEIKEKVEAYLKSRDIDATFNSVLINLYRDGKDSVSWHSDDEIMLGICPTIASVSLGETRKFEMRPKIRNHDDKSPADSTCKYFINLCHGSLVVMTGAMQDDWQHRVPKEYHDRGPRLNLTFRTVHPLEEVIHLVRKRRALQRKSWNRTPRKKISFDSWDLSLSGKGIRRDLRDEEPHEQKRKRKSSVSYFSDDETCARRHKRKRSDSYFSDERTYARRQKRKGSDSYASDEEVSARNHRRKPSDSCVTDEETSARRHRKKRSDSYVSDDEPSARKHKRKRSYSYVSDEETCARSHEKRSSDSYVGDEKTCARSHKKRSSDSYVGDEKTCSSDSYVSDEEARARRHRKKRSDTYVSDDERSAQKYKSKRSYSYVSDEETCAKSHKKRPSDSHENDEETCPRRHRKKTSDSYENDKESCAKSHKIKPLDSYVNDEVTCTQKHRREPSDSDNTD